MTPYLRFDASLIEEAVLLAIDGRAEERQFRKTRDRIYEVTDGEGREKLFRDLHSEWFVTLRLGDPVASALREHPSLTAKTSLCAVVPSLSSQDEGAALHRMNALPAGVGLALPSIMIRVRPRTLLDPVGLAILLRRELTQIDEFISNEGTDL